MCHKTIGFNTVKTYLKLKYTAVYFGKINYKYYKALLFENMDKGMQITFLKDQYQLHFT